MRISHNELKYIVDISLKVIKELYDLQPNDMKNGVDIGDKLSEVLNDEKVKEYINDGEKP
mgnify:CR=1 FL=1